MENIVTGLPFDVLQASATLLITFGTVAAINFWRQLTTKQNFVLSFVFFFAYSFIPADFGNMIANKLRDAYVGAMTLNGAYQFLSKLMLKLGKAVGEA